MTPLNATEARARAPAQVHARATSFSQIFPIAWDQFTVERVRAHARLRRPLDRRGQLHVNRVRVAHIEPGRLHSNNAPRPSSICSITPRRFWRGSETDFEPMDYEVRRHIFPGYVGRCVTYKTMEKG